MGFFSDVVDSVSDVASDVVDSASDVVDFAEDAVGGVGDLAGGLVKDLPGGSLLKEAIDFATSPEGLKLAFGAATGVGLGALAGEMIFEKIGDEILPDGPLQTFFDVAVSGDIFGSADDLLGGLGDAGSLLDGVGSATDFFDGIDGESLGGIGDMLSQAGGLSDILGGDVPGIGDLLSQAGGLGDILDGGVPGIGDMLSQAGGLGDILGGDVPGIGDLLSEAGGLGDIAGAGLLPGDLGSVLGTILGKAGHGKAGVAGTFAEMLARILGKAGGHGNHGGGHHGQGSFTDILKNIGSGIPSELGGIKLGEIQPGFVPNFEHGLPRLDNIGLQQSQQSMQRMMEMLSNIMKKQNETQNAIIRNIAG